MPVYQTQPQEDKLPPGHSEESLHLLTSALEAAANGIAITDTSGKILWVNHAFSTLTGYAFDEVVGGNPRVLKSGAHDQNFYQTLWETVTSGRVWQSEIINRRKDGTHYHEEMTITPVKDEANQVTHFIAVKHNVSARKQAEAERAQMEVQLRHAQKMESIGQLAAGIAHEINTPIQYVGDNVRFLEESFKDLGRLLAAQQLALASDGDAGSRETARTDARQIAQQVDLEYLLREVPTAIQQTLDGIDRVSRIVRAMKEFSHPGARDKAPSDLNKIIENTVIVARNEWKYVATMKLELDPALPLVSCIQGDIGQVVLNLVINAAHAIEGRPQKSDQGVIQISTSRDRDRAVIQVSDTGTGIPEPIRERIFDPFFTTKEVGQGTGQGLALVHAAVVDKHGGEISFATEEGVGTTFTVRLPFSNGSAKASVITSP